MVSSNYFYLVVILDLHTMVWFHVFLSYTNDFQTDVFEPWRVHKQVLPLQAGMDLGVMAMKLYSLLPRAPSSSMDAV